MLSTSFIAIMPHKFMLLSLVTTVRGLLLIGCVSLACCLESSPLELVLKIFFRIYVMDGIILLSCGRRFIEGVFMRGVITWMLDCLIFTVRIL